MINNDIYNSAIKYTNEYQWVVHPLSPPTDRKSAPGKRPLLKEWSNLQQPLNDEELESYFKDKNVNIGLVCGKASNVTVIDVDDDLFLDTLMAGIDETTLIVSKRTANRGHIYFKHIDNLRNYEYEYIKIDVRNDNDKNGGGNIVLPPSIHLSGEKYNFNKEFLLSDIPTAPPQFLNNLTKLINLDTSLSNAVKKCRKWVREFLSNPDILHGHDGRRCMIALCAELKANGFIEDMHGWFISKIVYRGDFDETVSRDQWGYIEPYPWTSERLITEFPEYCNDKNTRGNQPNKPDTNDILFFEIIDDKKFKNIRGIYTQSNPRKLKNDGRIIYSCTDEEFYNFAIEHGAIAETEYKEPPKNEGIIDTVDKLESMIECMEIKDGKQPIYYVKILGGTLRFEPDTLLNIAKWRESLLANCKVVMGLRSKELRQEFDCLIAKLVQESNVIWNDTESDEEMYVSMIYEELSNLIHVDTMERFRRMEMSCYDEDNHMLVKSSTMHRIMKNKNINIDMRKVREILRPSLVKNSQQVRIDGVKMSVWFFKCL